MRYLYFWLLILIGCSVQPDSKNKVVNIRLGADINYINPLLSGSAYARQVAQLIFLPLCQYDPVDLNYEPILTVDRPKVEKLENERVRYDFQLRPEAKWTDGKDITAADYHFTFKMIFNPSLPTHAYRAYLSFLDSITVHPTDPKLFSVFTNRSYHLAEVVLSNIEIFPKHIYDSLGVLENYDLPKLRDLQQMTEAEKSNQAEELTALEDLATDFKQKSSLNNPLFIGSGPYELTEWKEKERVVLKKKKNFWAENMGNVPRVLLAQSSTLNFKIIPDRQSAFQSLKAEEIDIMNETPPLAFQQVRNKEINHLQGANPPQFLYYYIAMNPGRPAFSNPELRQAMSHLFDNQQWIDQQLYGLAVPVTNPISPLKSYYDNSLPPRSYQPDKSKAIYRENGFLDADGSGILSKQIDGEKKALRLKLAYSVNNPTARSLATFFAAKAKAAGVEIIPDPMDFSQLRKSYASGSYDMIFLASGAPPSDYDPQQSWHTKSWDKGNYVRFGNDKTDNLIERIITGLDAGERVGQYKLLQKEIYESCPFIFLYSPLQTVSAQSDLLFEAAKVWPGFVINTIE